MTLRGLDCNGGIVLMSYDKRFTHYGGDRYDEILRAIEQCIRLEELLPRRSGSIQMQYRPAGTFHPQVLDFSSGTSRAGMKNHSSIAFGLGAGFRCSALGRSRSPGSIWKGDLSTVTFVLHRYGQYTSKSRQTHVDHLVPADLAW